MRSVLFGASFALAFTLFLTPVFIRLFDRLGWGQFIRDDGPQSHHTKRGTPTMGGIVIILGAVIGYGLGHLVEQQPPTLSGLLVILMMTGMGIVGFIDDFTKSRKQRSLGLGGWAKVFGQALVATVFALLAIGFPDANGITPASGHQRGQRRSVARFRGRRRHRRGHPLRVVDEPHRHLDGEWCQCCRRT